MPQSEFEQYGIINERHMYPKSHQQQPAAPNGKPAQALVATPKIEAQPWVRKEFCLLNLLKAPACRFLV
jgi:hypothetical protein